MNPGILAFDRVFRPLTRVSLLFPLTVLLASCSVAPQQMTRDEIATRISRDQNEIYREQESLREPITFSVALARALKYNLDYRLKLMETAMARGLLDVAKLDLLPKLVAEAGYNHRNNDSGGTSIGIEDRQVSLRPSTSEERSYAMGRAAFSWNALDFGISYYRAKQAADEYLITEERRRKILQNIVQDVRNAYWRAVGAQRLAGEAELLLVRIREALERSRDAERAGVLPPTQALAYQRALLDAMTLTNLKRQEMEFAKRELAALMNVTPGTDFRLADVSETRLAGVPVNVGELELIALQSRPELREEDYRARIGQNEARKQLVAMFPNLNFFVGANYNSNTYLYNNNWADSGATLSLNLLRLTGLPAIERANEARAKSDEARRLALSMAIITQVRVSVERYKLSMLDYDLAVESAQVDQRLAAVSRAASSNKLESELEALRTESRSLVSRFQQMSSYAAAHAAHARIMNSLGIDLLPAEVRGTDIPALAKAIESAMLEGERDAFLVTSAEIPQPRMLAVRVGSLPEGVSGTEIRAAAERALTRTMLKITEAKGVPVLTLSLERPAAGAGRALWQLRLIEPDGRNSMTATYGSFLPAAANERTLNAFAEAAVLSVIPKLREALTPQDVAAVQR